MHNSQVLDGQSSWDVSKRPVPDVVFPDLESGRTRVHAFTRTCRPSLTDDRRDLGHGYEMGMNHMNPKTGGFAGQTSWTLSPDPKG